MFFLFIIFNEKNFNQDPPKEQNKKWGNYIRAGPKETYTRN